MSTPRPVVFPSWALGDPARIATDRAGVVVAWNGAAEELYGYSSHEAIGRPVVDLIVPLRGRPQAAEIMEALALGRTWEGEFEVRRRDGRLIRVPVHDSPSYDAEGAVPIQRARMRLLRGWCSSSARPSASSTGGT